MPEWAIALVVIGIVCGAAAILAYSFCWKKVPKKKFHLSDRSLDTVVFDRDSERAAIQHDKQTSVSQVAQQEVQPN